MAKYTSGRQKNLKVGISSYSENLTSLEVIGKVGIGTTNPGGRNLYVIGNVEVSGVSTLGGLQISSGIITAAPGFSSVTYWGDGSKLTGIGSAASAQSVGLSTNTTNTTTSIIFSATPTANPTATLNSNPNLIFNAAVGRLGIGSTNPTATLDVGGDVKISGVSTLGVTTTTNLTAQQLNVSGITTVGFITATNLYVAGISTLQSTTLIGNGTSTGTVGQVLQVSGINSSVYIGGLVGIGTTNPTSKLQVIGNVLIGGIVTASSFSGNASTAGYASTAGIATYATSSGIATYSTSAGIATYATSSGIATYATSSGIATYATSSGIATYATSAGIATYSTSSGIATYATSAGIATYATSAGIATYATSAGIATYATSSGIATYATSSGIATYATTAGVSTSVIGGIASVTQLYVSSGITTLGVVTSGNIYSTGIVTASQFSTGSTGIGINTDTISGPAIMYIDPAPVGVGTTSGIVRIRGDLYVDGTQFIVNSTTIELADFNVGIATTVGTDLLLDGAGIGIGSINIRKTFTYNNSANTLESSIGLGVTSGGAFKTGTSTVLTSTTLGSGVVNSSLTSIGTLGQLNVSGVTTFSGITTHSASLFGTQASFTGVVTASSFSGNVSVAGYASTAGIATYATSSGIATYATSSGVSTSVIGGIGSITQLQVTGISTFSNGPVLVGAATSTGTASQPLQVTGGAAFIGVGVSVGVGTTNPQGILHVYNTSTVTQKLESVNIAGYSQFEVTSGIGTTAISALLYASSAEGSIIFRNNSNTTGSLGLAGTRSSGADLTIFRSTRNIVIGDSPAEASQTGTANQKLQVQSGAYVSGSVGIGTTRPTTKLTISGSTGISFADTNVRIGDSLTGSSITNGINNFFGGSGSGQATNTGNENVFLGLQAGRYNTTGIQNIFVGKESGYNNGDGYNNTFLGSYAGRTNTGNNNNFFGKSAGRSNTTGTFNNFFGSSAGYNNIDGGYNVFLGSYAGQNQTTGSQNVILGYNQNTPDLKGSNQLVIGAGNTAWIYGNNSYNVGLGTTNPTSKLYVVGDGRFTGVVTATKFSGDGSLLTNVPVTSLSGFATYASFSGISTSVIGGIGSITALTVSGVSTLGIVEISSGVVTATSGVVTYYGDGSKLTGIRASSIVGFVTYATSSGIATYATSSGVSTSVIGGIGSITQLQVTGVSTFTNGPVLIGTGTSTGTASQPLQVTGGAYFNGNIGIGTTTPTVKLQVSGGDVTIDRGSATGSLLRNLTIGGARNSATGSGFAAINFQNYDSSNAAVDYNGVRLIAQQPAGANNGGLLVLYTTPNTSTTAVERVRFFDTGEVGINTTVLTGTSSQLLQVTGGAYISGSVGLGTINPTSKLQVVGDALISGVATATSLYLSGIVTSSNPGVSTIVYYGDGSNLTGIGTAASSQSVALSTNTTSTTTSLVFSATPTSNPTATLNSNPTLIFNATNSSLGIGTTNPTSTLTVVGNALFSVTGIVTAGIVTATKYYGDGSSLSGLSITGNINSTTGINTIGFITSTNIYVSGIATLGRVQVSSGIITATSGIITYYGDGSKLSSISAGYASTAGIATYATSSGIATYATNAGIATYATSAGIATYATSAGIATYATTAGIATYAPTAGIATYATSAGIATNVIGGIGSITQLQVTGISTFTNGPVLIGLANSTGTANQILQVGSSTTIRGVYISGNLGIGTTNPRTKVEINGVLGFNNNNVRIGDNTTGANLTSGVYNNFIGVGVGSTTTTGSYNNFLGFTAGGSNDSGNYNNFFGRQAGYYNVGGSYNNFFGRYAGYQNQNGTYNNFLGHSAGRYNTGNNNNFVGSYAGQTNSTGNYNNFFGFNAGRSNTTGNRNIFLGNYTGRSTTASYKVVFGSGLNGTRLFDSPNIAKDKQFAVGLNSTGTSEYWLVGNENFNIGIGSTNPREKLSVVGNVLVSGAVTATTFYGDGSQLSGIGTASSVVLSPNTSSTATSIVFSQFSSANPTSQLNSNPTLIFNAATSSLGIGTTNPVGQLQVSSGPVIIGAATSTGTASQPLQVTGGAYVSGPLGVGTTLPLYNLHIYGPSAGAGSTIAQFDNNVGVTRISIVDETTVGSKPPGIRARTAGFGLGLYAQAGPIIFYNNNTDVERGRFDLSGNLGIGTTNPTEKLQVQGNISINGTTSYGSTTATTATVSQIGIHSGLSTSTYRSIEYTIQATQGTNFHATKILAIHDGTTAYNSEYGTIYNNASVGTFDVDLSGGNVRLLVTPASSSSTTYTINFVATKI